MKKLKKCELLVSVNNPTSREIVRGQFDFHSVPGENLDVTHSHLSGNMCQYFVVVVKLNSEFGVRESFRHLSLDLNWFFFVVGHRLE